MTLLIALSCPGLNCIIADLRVSYDEELKTGANHFLKTGELFTGCIYGITGATGPAKKFIRSFKEVMRANPEPDLPTVWLRFSKYASLFQYNIQPLDAFQLIISERSTGLPRFFVLDSKSSQLSLQPHLATEGVGAMALQAFGSGAPLVQEDMDNKFLPIIGFKREYLIKEYNMSPKEADSQLPYIICGLLSDQALMERRDDYKSNGVGGMFHFISQDADQEARQKTAWHLINQLNPEQNKEDDVYAMNKVVPLSNSIAFSSSGLAEDDSGDVKLWFLVDDAADYEATDPSKSEEEMENLRSEYRERSEKANYCGMYFYGSKGPNIFRTFRLDCKESDFLNSNGTLTDYWYKLLRSVRNAMWE